MVIYVSVKMMQHAFKQILSDKISASKELKKKHLKFNIIEILKLIKLWNKIGQIFASQVF